MTVNGYSKVKQKYLDSNKNDQRQKDLNSSGLTSSSSKLIVGNITTDNIITTPRSTRARNSPEKYKESDDDSGGTFSDDSEDILIEKEDLYDNKNESNDSIFKTSTKMSSPYTRRGRGRPRKQIGDPKSPYKKKQKSGTSKKGVINGVHIFQRRFSTENQKVMPHDITEQIEENTELSPGEEITNFVFLKTTKTVKKEKRGRPRQEEVDKRNSVMGSDVFSSPRTQRHGIIQLTTSPASSKKGLLPNNVSKTPSGRNGSPRKRNLEMDQDFSARKRATNVLYNRLIDAKYDYDEQRGDFESNDNDIEIARKIIKESKTEEIPNTPRRQMMELPVYDAEFTPTLLPSREEEERFFESKFEDKALFLDGPEGYFDQNRGRIKTSSNSMVQAPQLEYDEFNSLILLSGFLHHSERESLLNRYRKLFNQWYFELQEGFNLCFYGVGSKRTFLLEFVDNYLLDRLEDNVPTIVVNGYNPATNFKQVLNTMVSHFKLKNIPKRIGELVEHIINHISRKQKIQLVLLIHNIDGKSLRDEKTQTYFSRIVKLRQVYCLASIDHINSTLLWNSGKLSNYNFIWHNLSTFSDYLTETSFEDLMILGQTQKSSGSKGAKYVISSLTANSRSLYRVLVSNQLENMDEDLASRRDTDSSSLKGQVKHGLEYKRFYVLCAEEFIASNEINFRTMLLEFVEHKMAALVKDESGTEIVYIPFIYEELQRLLEDELLS